MLKFLIAISGWIILGLYLAYEYQEYGPTLAHHLFSPAGSLPQFFFHIIVIFTPVAGTYTGYLMHHREHLQKEVLRREKLQALGSLTGRVAHDFKGLLSVISDSLSEVKTLSRAPEEVKNALANAEKATSEAHELVRELMSFSGGFRQDRKIAIVENVVRQACEALPGNRNLRYEQVLPSGLWPAVVDEARLREALQRVIANAAHVTPPGGTIRIECENTTVGSHSTLPLGKGYYVKISVKDEGGEVSEEQLQSLFDPYNASARGNSDLDMASAFSIIRQNDGHVTATTEKGTGIAVHIYLPVPGDNGDYGI